MLTFWYHLQFLRAFCFGGGRAHTVGKSCNLCRQISSLLYKWVWTWVVKCRLGSRVGIWKVPKLSFEVGPSLQQIGVSGTTRNAWKAIADAPFPKEAGILPTSAEIVYSNSLWYSASSLGACAKRGHQMACKADSVAEGTLKFYAPKNYACRSTSVTALLNTFVPKAINSKIRRRIMLELQFTMLNWAVQPGCREYLSWPTFCISIFLRYNYLAM